MPLERPQKLTESDHMSPHPDSPEGLAVRVAALERQVGQLFKSMEVRRTIQEADARRLTQEIEGLSTLCSQSPPASP